MDITLNNVKQNGLYLFDGIPNIVEFTSLGTSGTGAQLVIDLFTVTPSDGYYLTINGETVTSVVSQMNASSRQFGTNCSAEGLASNIVEALSSIPSIVSSYELRFTSMGSVVLSAYGKGSSTAITYDSNIPNAEFTYTPAAASSGAMTANLVLNRNNPSVTARLSKTVASDTVRFNISEAIASMSDRGMAVPVSVRGYVTDAEGDVTTLYTFNEKVVQGWHTKGHEDYVTTHPFLAQNVKGAPDRDVYNSVVLYALQGSDVHVSWCPGVTGSQSATWQVLDSAFGISSSGSVSHTFAENEIGEFVVPGSATAGTGAWYLSVTLPDNSVIRYNLIRSGMSSGCTRLWWRNSMGGVSFFDFTGERSEKTDISSVYMYDEGSSYGYYTDEYRHDSTLYSQTATKTYTVQSSIIEEAGCPIVDDLASSRLVWVEDDGKKKMVLVTAVEKVKVASNGTYRLKVSYKYSVNE